jgi:hypothetical protein
MTAMFMYFPAANALCSKVLEETRRCGRFLSRLFAISRRFDTILGSIAKGGTFSYTFVAYNVSREFRREV